MEVREQVERFAGYFERIAREYGGHTWDKGFQIAQEWLRLINKGDVSRAELSAFIDMVHANRCESSGLSYMAGVAYDWVTSKGLVLPSPDVFFASDMPASYSLWEMPSPDLANLLIERFDRNSREDPGTNAWTIGLSTAQAWLKLIQAQDITRPEVSTFVQHVRENQRNYLTHLGFYLTSGIWDWCSVNGYLDLVPADYRMNVKRSN